MGQDSTTIRRFIAKYKKTGEIEIYHDQGEKKNTLVNEVIQKRREPLHEIIKTLGLDCSLTTTKKNNVFIPRSLQNSLSCQKGIHLLILIGVKYTKKKCS